MAASGTFRRAIAPQVYGPYEDTRLSEGLWLASKLPDVFQVNNKKKFGPSFVSSAVTFP